MFQTERLFKSKYEKQVERGEWFRLTDKDIEYLNKGKFAQNIVDSIGPVWKYTLPDIYL